MGDNRIDEGCWFQIGDSYQMIVVDDYINDLDKIAQYMQWNTLFTLNLI